MSADFVISAESYELRRRFTMRAERNASWKLSTDHCTLKLFISAESYELGRRFTMRADRNASWKMSIDHCTLKPFNCFKLYNVCTFYDYASREKCIMEDVNRSQHAESF